MIQGLNIGEATQNVRKYILHVKLVFEPSAELLKEIVDQIRHTLYVPNK